MTIQIGSAGRARRPGFTLIELLVVVVIIGILASVAAVKYRSAREAAWLTMLKSDLENLTKHQEIYHFRFMEYATLADLTDFVASPEVDVTLNYVDGDGWGGVATHPNLPSITCGIMVGNAPDGSGGPATVGDVITCG